MTDTRDHLVAMLLHGAAGEGTGIYNNYDAWDVRLGVTDVTSDAARVITVHEALHAALNDSTAFGMGLAAYAVLGLDAAASRGALARLVDMCRTVHEAFATFQSVWLVGAGNLGLLAGYPAYRAWYQDASDLIDLPDSSRAKEMMIEAAARACMQSHVLEHLLTRGLSADAPATVPNVDRPDVRYGLLHRHADSAFWAAAWSRCADTVGETAAWQAIAASEIDPSRRQDTYASEYQATLATVAHVLYEAVAELLVRHGAPVLDYDGHREYTAQLIAAVEHVAPHARGRLLASSDDATVDDEAFEMWRRERLVVRTAPRPARLHQLTDLSRKEHIRLVSEGSGKAHVFVTARPAFRLLQQFDFSAADRDFLRGLGSSTIVTARRAATDDGPVDLTVIAEPGQLRAIVKAWRSRPEVYANVALSSLGDIPWRDRWSRALRSTQLTGLLDLSPFAQFDAWRQEHEALTYVHGTVTDEGGIPCAVFACIVGKSNLTLLLPCTSVTAHILEAYLQQSFPAAREDPAVLQRELATVQLTMSHLLAEEYSFDVSAYHWEEPGGLA